MAYSQEENSALDDLIDFLKIQSSKGNSEGLINAGEWLQKRLTTGNWAITQSQNNKGCPPLIAARKGQANAPMLLVYSHYDVLTPLRSEWKHEPFGADIVEDLVIACGARDAKANLLGAVLAAEQVFTKCPQINLQVLLVFEGEEKSESPRLLSFVKKVLDNKTPFGIICADGGGYTDRDEPTMELGLKGQLSLRIEIRSELYGTPRFSIHSGHASLVKNPIELLVPFLASLKDVDDNMTLSGFYDDVALPERPYAEPLGDGDSSFLNTLLDRYGHTLASEKSSADILNRVMFRPELNIASINSGETGNESRLVPSHASANIDINLVPNQEPDKVLSSIKQRLEEMKMDSRCLHVKASRPAYRCSPTDPLVNQAIEALTETHPDLSVIVLPSSASSGPVSVLPRTLQRPMLRLGTGYRGHAHTPDESIRIAHYFKYIDCLRALLLKAGGA